MNATTIKRLFKTSPAETQSDAVQIEGWVRTRRDSKAGMSFIEINDGSCFDSMQVVVDADISNYAEDVQKLSAGCAVCVQGRLVESSGKGQSVEIHATVVEVVGWVEDAETYPIAKKRHSFEYLREVAHLRPRTNAFGAITRVRAALAQAIHRYFHERDFYWVNTPLITASDAEGAGELFRVSTLDMVNLPMLDGNVDYSQDFFGKEAFLTVSGQLNVECYAMALTRVYTFGPTFRAENSGLKENADLAEDFLKYLFNALMNECEDDMAFFAARIDKQVTERLTSMIDSEFERMEYTDAIEILKSSKKSFEYPVTWGLDLQSEHERYLAEEHVGRPVILMNYPKEIKAFYMRRNDDERTVAAMDVLAPGIGELIGGSQREERLDYLDARLAEMGISEELYWYRDLRRYGTAPHAGFGLGFERLINYVTGMENIRDAIPFPRTPRSASF